jgi:hypothetical protein
MGVTMRLRANNLFIAVRKLISTTNLRMCANKLLILDNYSWIARRRRRVQGE